MYINNTTVMRLMIHHQHNPTDIKAKIAKIEGVAIGIGHPRKKTLQAIKEEIPVLKRQGIHFGYASAAVR